MQEIQIIEQREVLGREFKIYGDFENLLFLAKDVANWIEHSNSRVMLQSVDENEKLCVNNPYALQGQQEQWFLTEDGLYEVLMQSRKPIAKEFKKEVKQILKSIRKNGMYAKDELLDNPDMLIAVVTKLKEERELRKALEVDSRIKDQQIAELQPKASYYDIILQCKNLLSMTQIAKDYGMSAKKMNYILHNLGVQFKQSDIWLLYAKYQDKGYTQTKTQNYNKPDGTQGASVHTYWTQKGRLFLYDFLKNKGILPMIEKENVA